MLCASARRKERSLESGLKYLIIGSIGSATLLYGFALLYGASGSTDFAGIADALGPGGNGNDTLVLIGIGDGRDRARLQDLAWRPSTSGRPTSTRARPPRSPPSWPSRPRPRRSSRWPALFEVALGPIADDWKPASPHSPWSRSPIGNIGALGQDSLKRLLGYSGIAQAGYMLAGVVVATETGLEALVFYLAAYTLMNLAVFAVVVAARARDRARRRHRVRRRHRRAPGRCSPGR